MTLERKKEIGLVIVTALYSLLVFLSHTLFLRAQVEWGAMQTIVMLVLGLLWVAVYASVFSFLASRGGPLGLFFILPPALITFVLGEYGGVAIVTAAVMGLLMASARRSIAVEMKERVKIRVPYIFRQGVRALLFGLLVSLIVVSLPHVQRGVVSGQIRISPALVRTVIAPATPLLRQMLPGYTSEASIDQLIDRYVQEQQASLPVGIVVPQSEKIRVKTELGKSIGLSVQGTETLSELVAEYINQYLQDTFRQVSDATSNAQIVFLAVGLLLAILTLRAIATVLVWPIYALIITIIYASERIGLVIRVKNQVTVEQLHL